MDMVFLQAGLDVVKENTWGKGIVIINMIVYLLVLLTFINAGYAWFFDKPNKIQSLMYIGGMLLLLAIYKMYV